MLATLKIRSHSQFVLDNRAVNVSDYLGEEGPVVTPYRADLRSKAFFHILDLSRTATDQTPASVGKLVIEQLEKAQAPTSPL